MFDEPRAAAQAAGLPGTRCAKGGSTGHTLSWGGVSGVWASPCFADTGPCQACAAMRYQRLATTTQYC